MKQVASEAPPEVWGDAKVRVEGVSKYRLQHGQPFAVLQDVHLYANAGEFVSLIGPSGCGKSTLLNIIAGLEQPSSGTLYLNGRRAEQRLGAVGYAAEGPAAALEECPGQCHSRARTAGDVTSARACPRPGADGAVWAQGVRDGLSLHPLGWYAAAGRVPADDPA